MRASTLITSLLAAPLMVSAGMYREPVVELDGKSFKKVMANEHASMVAFVAPWCGHCKNLGPEFTAAAQSLSPLIPFYTVDCDESENKGLCREYGVEGFPTIKAFPRGSKGSARDYNGERQRGSLVDYAKGLVPERVKKLRADDGVEKVIGKFLAEKSTLPHALLVHPSAPSIPFLWKVLGHRLTGKAQLGYIRDTPSHDVLVKLENYDSSVPGDTARLVYWNPGADSADVINYDGPLKFNALLEWLETVIGGDVPPPTERQNKKEKKEADSGESAEIPKAAATPSEDAAARRARLQAKMDEIERRDRLRREKLAAKKAQEEQEDGGTPVDAPAAEPAEDAEQEDAPMSVPVEAKESSDAETIPHIDESASPVDAPAAEPAQEGDEEEQEHARDEL